MKKLSAHYPEYFPTPVFFQKLLSSDVFIITDNLKFSKHSTINRALIKTRNGIKWLTVPVITKGQKAPSIQNAVIDTTSNWNKKHARQIYSAYKNSPYFEKYFPEFSQIILMKWTGLVELNMKIADFIINDLEIDKKIITGSDLHLEQKGRNLITEMLEKTESDTYITEIKYEDYLRNHLDRRNIHAEFMTFGIVTYKQLFQNFIPELSIMDILFNHGRETKDIILETI